MGVFAASGHARTFDFMAGDVAGQTCGTREKETLMRDRFAGPMISVSIAAASVGAVVPLSNTRTSAQAPAASVAAPAPAQALKTPWGEPNLQGIWTDEFDTPFQRPAKYARGTTPVSAAMQPHSSVKTAG
jgi:hypothetical protein